MMQKFLLPLLALVALTQVQAQEKSAPPNVLFILADDLNCSLGSYGDPTAITPHLDALSQRGLTFNRAYCQQAVCNPSRASLLTGLRPDTIQVWDLRAHFRDAKPDLVTLPQHFKNQGYHSECIGKMYHNTGELGDEPSWSVPARFHEGTHAEDTLWWRDVEHTKGPVLERTGVKDEDYLDGRIANAAVEAMERLKDEPFFLAVGFWRPHLPFVAPKKYWDLYDPQEIPLPNPPLPPRDGPEIALHDVREFRSYQGVPKDGRPDEELLRELRQGYYASISYLDANVGKVVDALDRLGLSENTIIVFASDHGFHIGERKLWAKTTNFELDARVPLIIAAPQATETRGKSTDGIAELVDLYPTLASLAGLPAPAETDGVDLSPLFSNPESSVRDHALSLFPRPNYYRGKPEAMGYSLRTPEFRYTEWRDYETQDLIARELYDHTRDPLETVNQARNPEYKGAITELEAELTAAKK